MKLYHYCLRASIEFLHWYHRILFTPPPPFVVTNKQTKGYYSSWQREISRVGRV